MTTTSKAGKMPKDKSVGAALVLTILFGPLGLFYSVVWWAVLLMVLGAIAIGVFTWGIGAGVFWVISVIWGAVAASNKHGRYLAWLAAQQQVAVTRWPQGTASHAPVDLPPSPQQIEAQPAVDGVFDSPPSRVDQRFSREEAALEELQRLRERGLITEAEAGAKRAEILTALFHSPADHRGGEVGFDADSTADSALNAAASPDDAGEDSRSAADPRLDGHDVLADERTVAERAKDAPSGEAASEANRDAVSEAIDLQANNCVRQSPSPARRRPLLILATAVAVLLIAAVVALAIDRRDLRNASASSSGSHGAAGGLTFGDSESTSSSPEVKVSLPVKVLPTEVVSGWQPDYPRRITVSVPLRWRSSLTAYGVAGRVFVAPRNWGHVVVATVNQDGSASLELISDDGPIQGTLSYDGVTAVGGAWQSGSVFIPWLRKHWRESGLGATPPPLGPDSVNPWKFPHLTVRQLNPGFMLLSFYSPVGETWDSVLAHTTLTPGNTSQGYAYEQLYVSVSKGDGSIARVMTSAFIPEVGK